MSKTDLKNKKCKIYIAGRYGRRAELFEYAKKIEELGHVVTANWLRGNEVGQCWAENAQMDLDDVLRADLLILFIEQYGSTNVGGGRHGIWSSLCQGHRVLDHGSSRSHFSSPSWRQGLF